MIGRLCTIVIIATACGSDDIGTGTASSTTNASIRSASAWVYSDSTDALGSFRRIQLHVFSDAPGTNCYDRGEGNTEATLLIAANESVPTITNFAVATRDQYPRSIPDILAVGSSQAGQVGDVVGFATIVGHDNNLTGSLSGTATTAGGQSFAVEVEFDAPICSMQ
jgi:hypothetical protein